MPAEHVAGEYQENLQVGELPMLDIDSGLVVTGYESGNWGSFSVAECKDSRWIEISSIGTLPDGRISAANEVDPYQAELTETRKLVNDAVTFAVKHHNKSQPNPERLSPKGDWMLDTGVFKIATAKLPDQATSRKLDEFEESIRALNEAVEAGNYAIKLVGSEGRPTVLFNLAGFGILADEINDTPKAPVLLIKSISGELGILPDGYRVNGTYEKVG